MMTGADNDKCTKILVAAQKMMANEFGLQGYQYFYFLWPRPSHYKNDQIWAYSSNLMQSQDIKQLMQMLLDDKDEFLMKHDQRMEVLDLIHGGRSDEPEEGKEA